MPLAMPPCSHPAVPAMITGAPNFQNVQTVRPYATFAISVDDRGAVTAATLEEGSGSADLDNDAAQAVRKWKFAPAADGCKPVAGHVEYAVPIGTAQQTFADPCNHDAAVAVQAQPLYPNMRDIWRVVQVQATVSLDAAGRITGHRIIQSSGYDALDKAALTAALHSSYIPEVHACRPVAGWHFFNVTFDPNA